MLAVRNVINRKTIINFAIIAVMISGTLFMLYRNHKINQENKIIENPPIVEKDSIDKLLSLPVETVKKPVNQAATTTPGNGQTACQNSLIDTCIFEEAKFKNLRDNTLVNEQKPEIGKKNPFESFVKTK